MPVLEIKNVSKEFQNITAVNDVSLSVEEGEAVAIIGSSGSGKSTLLRCINNLEWVTSGNIIIDGDYLVKQNGDVAEYPKEKEVRQICTKTGMVFQHFNLFAHLTCLENITIAPIKILGQNKQDAVANAKRLLDEVGLTGKEDSYPNQLSGGQQQRVAIARALAMDPKIMLFDEPTSALDPEIIGEVTNVIYKLVERQMTMLIVTHDMQFARDASSRVIYMDNGSIIEEGSPKNIFNTPQSSRLKEFLTAFNSDRVLQM